MCAKRNVSSLFKLQQLHILKTEVNQNSIKIFQPISQKVFCASIIYTNQLVMLREVMTLQSDDRI
jgi:hypothetical protein